MAFEEVETGAEMATRGASGFGVEVETGAETITRLMPGSDTILQLGKVAMSALLVSDHCCCVERVEGGFGDLTTITG